MTTSKTILKFITLLSLCLPIPLLAQDAKIAELFNSWSLIKADHKYFKEEQFDPILEISQTKSGTINYQSPNLLEQHYEKPLKGSIIFTPTLIKINFPNQKLELPVENFPEISLFTQTILNLLNGDLNSLSKHFKLDLHLVDKQTWSLLLTPQHSLKNHLRSIQIDGTNSQIESMLFTQLSGDWRKLTLLSNRSSTQKNK